jgi:HK97 family phage portal protein
MSIFDRIFGRKATPDQILRSALLGSQSVSGSPVTADSAMRIVAVHAAVNVIAKTLASLPLHVYERTPTGKRRAETHPLYDLLHNTPNPWQTSYDFRAMMQWHLCLRGNCYALIVWAERDRALELIPLHPDRMTVTQADDMSLRYRYQRSNNSYIDIPADEVLHVRGLSSDGILGRSILSDARDVIGLAQATQEYAGRLFKNDATPGVVIKSPKPLGKDAATRLRDSWNDAFSGSGNARKTAVLEDGLTVDRLSMTADDAQFLETRKFTRSEIAGLFGVPAHLIGDLERSTFSNIEHQGIEFATHCIRPWAVNWEQAIARTLFTAPRKYYCEFNLDALTRGDLVSRYQAYAVGRNWGWLSANDIRGLENLNPIAGGDVYLQPLNMVPSGVAPPSTTSAKAIYDGQEIDLSPTAGMKAEAERGLAWRQEFGRGGTAVGVARARDIINAKELSPSTVRRMYSFFARHEVDKDAEGFEPGEEGYPSAGRIAWALWGGDAGYVWSRSKVEQLNRIDTDQTG